MRRRERGVKRHRARGSLQKRAPIPDKYPHRLVLIKISFISRIYMSRVVKKFELCQSRDFGEYMRDALGR